MDLTGTKYTYTDLCSDLSQLQEKQPEVEVISIGRSVEGRNLFAVRLGSGPRRIHYTAGMHANEWITTPLLVRFCQDFSACLEDKQPLAGWDPEELSSCSSIWITPCMNPDGAELVQLGIDAGNKFYAQVKNINRSSEDFRHWKANIRGVDLNHQFEAGWSTQANMSPKKPSPRDHAGPGPLSEPESQALASFTMGQDFAMVAAFHSQGEVIYWGYRGMEPAESMPLATKMARLTGYRPVRYAGTHAGYKDWFIQNWRRPGFTVEVGRGKNPLRLSTLPDIYRKISGLLVWCAAGS